MRVYGYESEHKHECIYTRFSTREDTYDLPINEGTYMLECVKTEENDWELDM